MLKKYKSTEIQLSPVYFNSLTKIVINNKFDLEKAFQEILCSMNLVGLLNHLILNTLIFQLVDIYHGVLTLYYLLNEEIIEKELIKIKNNDQKCFVWCHIRHLNPLKIHPEKITRKNYKAR